MNYFLIDRRAYLVDLPGYGYAKVSQAEKERWAKLMESYFQEEADRITTGVLIVDIRHKPTANDLVMHDWFRQTGCPEIVVANKLDKLKKSEVEGNLQRIRETLELGEEDLVIPFPRKRGPAGTSSCGPFCPVWKRHLNVLNVHRKPAVHDAQPGFPAWIRPVLRFGAAEAGRMEKGTGRFRSRGTDRLRAVRNSALSIPLGIVIIK